MTEFGRRVDIQIKNAPQTLGDDDLRRQRWELDRLMYGLKVSPRFAVTVPGAPYAKSRPRFGRHGAYSSAADRVAEHRTSVFLRNAVRRPFTGNVGLVCLFFRPDRRRIDVDNLLKHVCDAANGVLWVDDTQCTAIAGVIGLDRDDPRTVIAVGVHESTMIRDLSNPKALKGAV